MRGTLLQQLTIENFELVAWQDVLEAHTSLLLNGYIIARQEQNQAQPIEGPDWLAFGLAHYIDSRLRARSGSLLVSWQEEGVCPSFSDVLKWRTLPRGPSAQKSACCVALSWLLAAPTSSSQLDRMFSRMAAGKSISPEWVATDLLAMESVDAMEDAWQRWTGKYRLPKADLGVLSSVTLERLRARLALRSGDSGIPGNLEPPRMALADLIALKRSAWIPAFCAAKSLQLEMLAAGRPAQFRELVDLYRDYLDALRRRKRDRTLERLLSKADSALNRLQVTIASRERYVDDVEHKYSGTIRPRGDDRLERSSFQDYVDEVEKRLLIDSASTNIAVLQKAQDDNEQKKEDGGRQD
jgi:hypothetical protein